MTIEVKVPTLGESVTEATVATWFKQPGDEVATDEMLCELETDKVTVEVPSPATGTLGEIVAPEGETVGVDALLATISEGAGADASYSAAPAAVAQPGSEEGTSDAGGTTDASDASGDGGEGQAVDVMVPALGESVSEATVATWFKSVGDSVEQDEMLCELETDKVSVEVPAPAAGTLSEIVVDEGGTVQAGGKLAVLMAGAGADVHAPHAVDPRPNPDAGPEEVEQAKANVAAAGGGRDTEDAPSAKKIMAEKGLDPSQVTGTGRDGRIMKEDALKAGKAPAPAPQPAQA
ncbi:biotin/lipoyl-containing protein, partial [Jannaschia aquimarina]